MFKSYPLATRFLLFVILPLSIAVAVGIHYLRGSLPGRGSVSVSAPVGAPVTLARDEHGVVYINAKSDADAFFAIGYAHAQDRLWQLDLQRRLAQGRLSEVFGRSTLQQDAWMRTLGLYGAAESAWARLDAQSRASLTAYAAGINAMIKDAERLPPEFLAFGVKPELWREVDSLAWAKVFALNLAGNMRSEVANLVASQYLAPQQLVDLGLAPVAPPLASTLQPSVTGLFGGLSALQNTLESALKIGGHYVGSNAWAVAGRLTSDGRPLLANDAHLGLQIPSIWYVAHLKGDRLDVSGMTLVGLPVVIFGRNREIAWGGTSMMADAQDLFLEQISADDPNKYADGAAWVAFDTRTEVIAIRADFPAFMRAPVESVKLRVRSTRHGPVVSDMLGALDQPVALRWTALDPDDLSYQSFLQLNYASDWNSFRQALEHYVAPALNLLYVDSSNIASISAGRFPLRARGEGRLPVPGWNDEHAWTGYVPFEQWPQRFNPDSGYIVSANDNPVGPDYAYFLSSDWAPPQRAQRIAALIEQLSTGERKLALADVERMQGDTVDLSVSGLLTYLRDVKPRTDEQGRALAYLRDWQGDMARDSTGASVFHVWTRHLREALFARSLKGYWDAAQQRELAAIVARTSNDQILAALTTRSSHWCAAPASDRSCAEVVYESLELTLSELRKLKGASMDSWKWGDLHHAVYASVPFSGSPFAMLFERRVASGGSPDSINVASALYRESEGYEQNFGAGFRQIIQPGTTPVHAYMNSTGQSGHPLSPFYDDMVRPFHDVRFFRLNDKLQPAVDATLTLTPERG
ncbi:MAG: penicillin acylase family protein [Rhodanobacteraceae bacterium]|nr:penicillin acylase family protein [Rhodanobacteraceae bacterium]